jgi:hypothetical protein
MGKLLKSSDPKAELNYRDVEEMMFERGVTVSHKTIRAWCQRFSVECTKDRGTNNRAKTKPIQKLPSYAVRIESPVGADEALCRMESDVWECDMRIVGIAHTPVLAKLN